MKKYRITENKLRSIIKEAVIDFINEERYSVGVIKTFCCVRGMSKLDRHPWTVM